METSVQFEYDPEKLIEAVKKRPGIWDYNDIDYRSKSVRYKLWNEIITELIGSDISISRSDMRELELQLQKKWKSMKDCFQKYVTKPTKTRRPYIYYNQLKFLLKRYSKNISQNDASSESEGERNKRVRRKKRKCVLKISASSDEECVETRSNDSDEEGDETKSNYATIEEDDTNDDTRVVIDVPQKIANTSKPAMDEFVFANVDSHNRNDNDDPDKMFLLSLLPHLKAIPEQYRLNVKMDLMEVLRNASFSSVDQKFL